MASLNNPFATAFSAPATPSMADVVRRQDLAKKLAGNDKYVDNSGFLGALGQALAGSGAGFQNTTAANEAQQGSDQAKAALAKALSGGYAGVQANPAAYVEAAGNSFLPPGEVSAANGYIGAQGQLAQQTAENAALMQRQKQQQQFDLNTPVPINPYSPGFINRATGEIMPTNGAGDGQPPLGTTGNPAIDPTMAGYSTQTVGNTLATQAAIDQAALQYLMTGKTPAIGRGGPSGLALRNAIINRAAEIDPTGNLAGNQASLKALSGSLTDQTKYANNTERAFNTANDTLSNLLNYMQKNGINPSDFPDANALGNYLQAHGKDAGVIAGYKSQVKTLQQEYSQVLAKGGVRSVETDREASQLIPDNLGPAQLAQVAAQIKIDADNAIKEAGNQVKKVHAQITGLGTPETPAATPTTKTIGGVTYTQDANGDWYAN